MSTSPKYKSYAEQVSREGSYNCDSLLSVAHCLMPTIRQHLIIYWIPLPTPQQNQTCKQWEIIPRNNAVPQECRERIYVYRLRYQTYLSPDLIRKIEWAWLREIRKKGIEACKCKLEWVSSNHIRTLTVCYSLIQGHLPLQVRRGDDNSKSVSYISWSISMAQQIWELENHQREIFRINHFSEVTFMWVIFTDAFSNSKWSATVSSVRKLCMPLKI